LSDPSSPPDEPLLGVPKRQAVHAIEGFDYQIWRMVEAWLGLGLDEALFMECAEDFDKRGPDGSVANQIKNSLEDISLGSEDVRSSICNYWRMCQGNPRAQRLSFRFLTQGGSRSEKSSCLVGGTAWTSGARGLRGTTTTHCYWPGTSNRVWMTKACWLSWRGGRGLLARRTFLAYGVGGRGAWNRPSEVGGQAFGATAWAIPGGYRQPIYGSHSCVARALPGGSDHEIPRPPQAYALGPQQPIHGGDFD